MNTVNKEVAAKLKEAGFDAPTVAYYKQGIVPIYNSDYAKKHNQLYNTSISAPDFLTAADWLFKKHGIAFWFKAEETVIKIKTHGIAHDFNESDHRNEAILFALNQITTKK